MTVTIYEDHATYDPPDRIIKPLDTVEFIMSGRTDAVTLSFDSSSPFAQSSFSLNGSSLTENSKTEDVSENASSGDYPFTVTPDDRDKPGTVHGDLEVNSDVPPNDPPGPAGG